LVTSPYPRIAASTHLLFGVHLENKSSTLQKHENPSRKR